ncbi:30S ribosomal protein S6 [Ignavibacteria bacterium 4148-Me]|uniref:30S ribosomal protein S6 n=1 Tax=Rosettibacter primus TaxID=3111523 RepID=UPI00336BB37C
MRTKIYESVVIINAALEDEQVEATISRLREVITTHGGEIVDIDRWGRKRLAYPIQKAKSGYYVIIRFNAPTNLISILERSLRLDENVIRYLTIALDKFALEAIKKQKESSQTEEQSSEEEINTNNESIE